jgi:phospholipase C
VAAPGLGSVDHLVVLMLENRSFDHMLGFLYAGTGNTSATQQAFDGLTGDESNPDGEGNVVPVFRITPDLESAAGSCIMGDVHTGNAPGFVHAGHGVRRM